MCHMVADSREELLEMVDKIGISRKHIQNKGTYREHFDICKSKRELAVKNGAVEISYKEMGRLMLEKKNKMINS